MKNKKNILFIFGTHAEAIKLAPLVLEMKKQKSFNVLVCSTGQHRDQLSPLLKFFSIEPDFDLELMESRQTLSQLSAACIESLAIIFENLRFDGVLVQGDTTSCFIGSLLSYYHQVPVFHVEAGLRSGDLQSPFPEEFNRKGTGIIASFHYAPTLMAQRNLRNERVPMQDILVTGNTGIDSLFMTIQKISEHPQLSYELRKSFSFLDSKKRLLLVTLHRYESFGGSLEGIFQGLRMLGEREDLEILVVLHFNPQVRESAKKILFGFARWARNEESWLLKVKKSNIWLTNPLDYVSFVYILKRSFLLMTDSGGVQEEGPSLSKPVLVVRHNTERPEGLIAGTSKLLPFTAEGVVDVITHLLVTPQAYEKMATAKSPYGDGAASQKITQHLLEWFQLDSDPIPVISPQGSQLNISTST